MKAAHKNEEVATLKRTVTAFLAAAVILSGIPAPGITSLAAEEILEVVDDEAAGAEESSGAGQELCILYEGDGADESLPEAAAERPEEAAAQETIRLSIGGREIPDGATYGITRQFLMEADNGDTIFDVAFDPAGESHTLQVKVTDADGREFAAGEEILDCEISGQALEASGGANDPDGESMPGADGQGQTGIGTASQGIRLGIHPIKSGTATVTVFCAEDGEAVKTAFTVEIETLGTVRYIDEGGETCGTSQFIVEASGEVYFWGYGGADKKEGYETVYPDTIAETRERIAAGEILIDVPIAYMHRVKVDAPGHIQDTDGGSVSEALRRHMGKVTVCADKVNEQGEAFVGWKDGGDFVSYSESYTMYVQKHITLTPVYARPESPEQPKAISSISGVSKGRSASNVHKHAYQLTASRVVPAAATKDGSVDEHGFLISTREIAEEQLTLDENGNVPVGQNGKALFKKKTGKKNGTNGIYVLDVITVNVPIYVRSYVIYTDRDNVRHIVYSDHMLTVTDGQIEQVE